VRLAALPRGNDEEGKIMLSHRLWTRPPAALVLLLVAALVGLAGPGATAGAGDTDDHAAARPAMGWSTWSFIRHNPTEANVEATAQAMHDSGLQAHGFQYVNVDDFYYVCPGRQGPDVDQFGRWVVDTAKFPHGMRAVGDFIHGLGLKFGLYVTPGISAQAVSQNTPIEGTSAHAADIATTASEKNYNCKGMVGIDYGKPGAQEFINSWARLLASYGVDYLKIDGVGSSDVADIQAWSRALRLSGRSVHLELSNNLDVRNGAVWRQLSAGWRISGDIECYKCEPPGSSVPLTTWTNVASRLGQAPQWTRYGGSGHYNDLDSLEIGNGADDGLTVDQRQSHLSLWAISAAPLILGTDLTRLDPVDLAMLTNDEVLGVDQAGVPGAPLTYNASTQVWRARESDGSYAVALFNNTAVSAPVQVTWSNLGFQGPARVRDLWSHQDLGVMPGGFSDTLGSDASRLLRVTPLTHAVTVVADAPGNGRAGTTSLNCPVCSDGVSVGLGGTLSFNHLLGPEGTYTVTVSYVNGGPPAAVTGRVAPPPPMTVSFPSTVGLDALQTLPLLVRPQGEDDSRIGFTTTADQLVAFDSLTLQSGRPVTPSPSPSPAQSPPESAPASETDSGE
jgi:hypothetical protein